METDLAIEQYGCEHYRRKCKIRAPCCGEIFDCRHCHNQVKDSLEVSISDRHEVPRHEIKLTVLPCGHHRLSALSATKNRMYNRIAQIVGHVWVNISVQNATFMMMMYQRTNFTVMDVAYVGCCYSYVLKDSHRCVERAMHHNCPVCFEYLFDSTKDISALRCGHTIHLDCLYEMRSHQQFSCPVCLRSACDMSHAWQKLDQEVAASPMPAIYQKKMIWILCNDCGTTSNVQFHILGHKCPGCSSYNTRQTRDVPAACSRV
uniref:CHY-type domain-containing protein n=1 Tax=Leersia perrieri TaxID=77586 RepID=A0A0D9VPI3_9ORYZ